MIVLSTDSAPTQLYTLSLHDALPICFSRQGSALKNRRTRMAEPRSRIAQKGESEGGRRVPPQHDDHRVFEIAAKRSEEHTSELQSLRHLVCRLLLEKKKKRERYGQTL